MIDHVANKKFIYQLMGQIYVLNALKLLPQMPAPIIIDQIIEQATNRGRINQELKAA